MKRKWGSWILYDNPHEGGEVLARSVLKKENGKWIIDKEDYQKVIYWKTVVEDEINGKDVVVAGLGIIQNEQPVCEFRWANENPEEADIVFEALKMMVMGKIPMNLELEIFNDELNREEYHELFDNLINDILEEE